MSIRFDAASQKFILETAHTQYVFQILHDQFPVHLHYGPRVDPETLSYTPREMSFSPYYKEYGMHYLPDTAPAEYSYFGSGDFRDTALRVCGPNGDSTTQFFYEAYEILKGRPAIDGMPYAAADERTETLHLTLTDFVTGCLLHLYYAVFEDCDVISRWLTLENRGDAPVQLEKCMSLMLDLPRCDFDMISLYGAHMTERNVQRVPLFHGRQSVGSRRGASSHQFNPFIALCDREATEETGEVYGFNFVYSGNFSDEVEVDQTGTARVMVGLGEENFGWRLESGECFTAPEAVMTYSAAGLGTMSRNFHRFTRQHILPAPKFERRPIVLNSWEASFFDIDEALLLDFARDAASCGMDMLVVDDGWFGARNNDRAGLGDWVVNRRKFTDGLHSFVQRVKSYGMKCGIWIEPEMVNPDSDLYRAHPDWCLQCRGRQNLLSREQLVLDFGNPAVLDYLKEQFSRTFDGVGIDYFKWDMNRHMSEVGSLYLPPERQKEAAHRYMLGVYALFEWFCGHFPHAMIENCSGGGGRYDLGMMHYSTQIWESDNTYPEARIYSQYGSTLAYPATVMSCHVSNLGNVCADPEELDFRFRTALAGPLGYELNITQASEAIRETIRAQVREYRLYEDVILNGELYRLENPFEDGCSAYYTVSADRSRILLTVLRDRADRALPARLPVREAEAEAVYRLNGTEETVSGAVLQQGVIPQAAAGRAQTWYFERI